MKIDARLHDAMHEYADTIEPEPGSWSRISARFDEPPSAPVPKRGAFALAGVALTLVIALIAVLVVRDNDDSARISTGPGGIAPMPSTILGITRSGDAVVLDPTTGEEQRRWDRLDLTAGSQIAVTPDGSRAFVVQGGKPGGLPRLRALGCGESNLLEISLADPARAIATVSDFAGAPTVSPDGRYLAYLRCAPSAPEPVAIVLRDLTTGGETETAAGDSVLEGSLGFTPDSRHVAFDVWEGDLTAVRRFDIVGGEPLPVVDPSFRDTSTVFRGPTDDSLLVNGDGYAWATRDGRATDLKRKLFRVPVLPSVLVSDRSGDHILSVSDDAVYRWSVGEQEPTKIADGVVGAAWIPDPPAPIPTQSSVAVLDRNRVVLIDGKTGSVARELFSHSGIDSVTPAVDGKSVYVITNDPGPCRGGPETFRVPLDGGEPLNLNLTGISSLVEIATTAGPQIAYTGAINCSDAGRLIGFTGQVAGGPNEVRLWGDATEVSILDASPDGRALLVRVVRPAGAALSIVDVTSGALTSVPGTDSVTVAAFSGDEGNQFIRTVREQQPSGRPAGEYAQLLDREGHVLDSQLVSGGSVLAIHDGLDALELLGVTETGRPFQWRSQGERVAYLDVPGRVTAAAWIPDSSSSVPSERPAVLIGAIDGNRLAMLTTNNGSEQTSYGSFPGISSVSGTRDGRALLFSYVGQSGACGDQPTPEVDRLNTDTLAATRIVGGAVTPMVSPDGKFVAYGITCDGPALGLTNLATGLHYRTDPLGGMERETSANYESVEVLGWSPNSKRLLYRLALSGSSYQHYYVGQLWPAVRQAKTEVVELPSGSNVSSAALIDDSTVALAVTAAGNRTVVHEMPIQQTKAPEEGIQWDNQAILVTGSGMFEAPGRITSLVADRSGRHFLVITDARVLYRWSVGEAAPTKIADNVTAASWAPWG